MFFFSNSLINFNLTLKKIYDSISTRKGGNLKMSKMIERTMQDKLQKFQYITAYKGYLENLITRYEKQIIRLKAKLPEGYMAHTILLNSMNSIEEKMRVSQANYYDGVVNYWKDVCELYDENFERNSALDAIICNRATSISILKFQIMILNIRLASLRKSLAGYIGNEVLDGVYLTPQQTCVPSEQRVLKKK